MLLSNALKEKIAQILPECQHHCSSSLLRNNGQVEILIIIKIWIFLVYFRSLDFNKDAWDEFREIDLDTFFNLTKPDIKVLYPKNEGILYKHAYFITGWALFVW